MAAGHLLAPASGSAWLPAGRTRAGAGHRRWRQLRPRTPVQRLRWGRCAQMCERCGCIRMRQGSFSPPPRARWWWRVRQQAGGACSPSTCKGLGNSVCRLLRRQHPVPVQVLSGSRARPPSASSAFPFLLDHGCGGGSGAVLATMVEAVAPVEGTRSNALAAGSSTPRVETEPVVVERAPNGG